MDQSLACVAAGPIISVVVSALKRIPFVKKYPKTVAFFVAAVTGSVTSYLGTNGVAVGDIIQCVLVQFSTAVATHESVTNQLQKFGDGNGESGEHDFSRGSL
jgi:hypothetical protein